jgi:hypothetical protein
VGDADGKRETPLTGVNEIRLCDDEVGSMSSSSLSAQRALFVLPVFSLLVAPVARAASAPALDPVEDWNQLTLTTVRQKKATDADAARLLAMVNVAVYDAVNNLDEACDDDRRAAALIVDRHAPSHASPEAAAVGAAHAVLSALHPDLSKLYDDQLARDLKRLGGGSRVSTGRSYGRSLGAQVVAARANDQSAPLEIQPGSNEVGQFSATWSGVQFRNLAPFAIANPADYVTAGPPPHDSLDYAAALAEVKVLGNAALADPDKTAIYQYWSLSAGTVQPPGEWMKIGLEVAAARKLGLRDKARLLALLGMALADTVAPTVTTKFVYRHWRPTAAIRRAELDDNGSTTGDESWTARAGAQGSSPEHTSGHSAFSAAGAEILRGFFCDDAIAFSHVTDSSGGRARSYASFSEAASEAGRSRVYGGVHFEFSNQAGLQAGRGVAAEVLRTKLLKKGGRTHLGACPL